MDPHGPQPFVQIAFHVYAWLGGPVPVAADRLRTVVPLSLVRRQGALRGEYYRWSGEDGADLLVQANVVDEDGVPLEPLAPAHASLVYATGLPGDVHAALDNIGVLTPISADVVTVPSTPGPAPALPQPIGSM
jgi:hypothetical protein